MYCHYCRTEIKDVTNNGEIIPKLFSRNCFCDECWEKCFKQIRPANQFVFCVFCGEKIKKGKKFPSVRYCVNCESLTKTPKQYAYSLNRKYPDKVKIVYECPCNVVKKVKHHPDYQEPFIIEKICHSCHMAAHQGKRYKQPSAIIIYDSI